MQVAQQSHGVFEQPAAIGVERDTRLREPGLEGADRFHLGFARQHPALELEILKAVAGLGRFSQGHHRLGGHGCLVAQAQPRVVGLGGGVVGQVGFAAVAHKKEVAEHGHGAALLAFTQQRADGNLQVLAEQVEKGGFHRRDRVDGGAQIKRLQAPSAGIAPRKGGAHFVEHPLPVAHAGVVDERACVFQRLADGLAPGDFGHARAPRAVGEDQQIAREERSVCA